MNSILMNKLAQAALLILLLLGSSCTKKTLEYPSDNIEGAVSITFDWKNLSKGDVHPSGMILSFFKSDGRVITKLCDDRGFKGMLPSGTYQVLAYNDDAVGVEGRYLDKYDEAQVIASLHTKANEKYILQPSNVYGVGLGTITVSDTEPFVKLISPIPYVRKASFKMNITGEKTAISGCSAELSGLVQSVNLATGKLQEDTGITAFIPNKTPIGFESTVGFLGKTDSSTNKLTVIFTFTGGGSQTVVVDVTNALMGTGGIIVPIDIALSIDVNGSVKGGYCATLKDWKIENNDIIVNRQ